MPYADTHHVTVDATSERAWHVVSRLGGDGQLYTPRTLWWARGAVERLAGGPGHRIEGPGRPLEPGDTMDFWRVEQVRAPSRLRLRAESLLPGTAFLEIDPGRGAERPHRPVAAHGVPPRRRGRAPLLVVRALRAQGRLRADDPSAGDPRRDLVAQHRRLGNPLAPC